MAATIDDLAKILSKIEQHLAAQTQQKVQQAKATGNTESLLNIKSQDLFTQLSSNEYTQEISRQSFIGATKASKQSLGGLFSDFGSAAETGAVGAGELATGIATDNPEQVVKGVFDLASAQVQVVEAIAGLPDKIKSFADSLLQAQFSLAQFSGDIAQIAAQREVFDIQRAQRIGGSTAGSTQTLENSFEKLQNAFEPLTVVLTNVENTGIAALVELTTVIVDLFTFVHGPLLAALNDIAEWARQIIGDEKQGGDWIKGDISYKFPRDPVPGKPDANRFVRA